MLWTRQKMRIDFLLTSQREAIEPLVVPDIP